MLKTEAENKETSNTNYIASRGKVANLPYYCTTPLCVYGDIKVCTFFINSNDIYSFHIGFVHLKSFLLTRRVQYYVRQ